VTSQSTPKFHMRRRDREITDPEKLRDVIRKATVCHLGLADGGEPYVVPVNFGCENNCLYFHSAASGHKIDLLKKNNRICFEIDADIEIQRTEKNLCKVNYRSVIGRGKAIFLKSRDDKERGIRAIMRQCAGGEYEVPQDLDSVVVVRIDIEDMTGKQAGY